MNTSNSEISQFYKRSIDERQGVIRDWIGDLDPEVLQTGLDIQHANNMIENVIGVYGLPLGIATNFLINGKDYLIPMVVEEPSVVAAASYAAKLARLGGGFTASSDEPIMIGQMQILDLTLEQIHHAIDTLKAHEAELMAKVDAISGSIRQRGGGVRRFEYRIIPDSLIGSMLIVHLLYDVRDAMGANAINTAVELLAADVTSLTGGRVHLKILSNLTDQRKVYAQCRIPYDAIGGEAIAQGIVEASVFAEVDPYRATTHNKGVMNGIDSVVIATGNDWRAVEAGAHAYVARDGSYTSMTKWRKGDDACLHGELTIPLAVGIVGGATRVHPIAQLALKILGVETAQQLAEIIACVGLAQNFAAIRALATDGIQQGHMRLHAKQLAIAAGASPELVPKIVERLVQEGNIRLERAKALVDEEK